MLTNLFKKAVVLLATIGLLAAGSLAQVRTVGRIVVSVEDAQGSAIVGAKLSLKDTATGYIRAAQSQEDGQFVFVDLPEGVYELAVEMQGFRKGVFSHIKVDVGGTANVTAKLEVGSVAETVVVEGSGEVMQTTSSTVENTVTGDYLRSLPLNNRNALDFVMLTAGAQQGGSARQATFDGLPKGAINITMDGLNIQDNLLKSSFGGGMFTIIQPRIDVVEEVSVSTAAANADAGGEGAVQVRFATRRGTSSYHGTGFWYHRDEWLNANTWFNNAAVPQIKRPRNLLNQIGANLGGPAPIKKDKLFFFFAFEDFRLPSATTRTNTVLTSAADTGLFTYANTTTPAGSPNAWTTCNGTTCSVDLMALAAANSYPSTVDPTINSMLSAINASLAQGSVSPQDLFRNTVRWDAPSKQHRWFDTLRLDYNFTNKIRWSAIGNWNHFDSSPDTLNSMDPSFPGIATQAGQYSKRWSASTALNWDIRSNLTSEFRIGVQRAHVKFFPESTAGDLYPNGLRLIWPLTLNSLNTRPGLSTTSRSLPSNRDTPAINQGGNIAWQHGKHTVNFGESLSFIAHWDDSLNNYGIPLVQFGVVSGDPVAGILSSTNIPGISTADLTNARALYALLTGRISSISGSNNVDSTQQAYLPGSSLMQRNRQNEFGLYGTDSWRLRRDLTLNYGLRWEYQGAPYNVNGIYTSPTPEDLWGKSGVGNLFKPGVMNGNMQPQIGLRTRNLWNSSLKNFGPSLGFAWTPSFDNKAWNALSGGKDKLVIRGGYSIAYTREGLNNYTQYAGGNPGLTQSITLNPGDPGFAPGALSLTSALPAYRTFPTSFTFPTPESLFTFSGNALYSIDTNIKTPYVQSWALGIQRELDKNTVLEIRYVGNHGTRLWRGRNLNEVNIFENGFLTEFQHAQADLAANIAGGCGNTFSPTTTCAVPYTLPIFTAAFGALGTQPALSAASGFANGTFVTQLQQGQAGAMANSLASSATFLCRMVGDGLDACAARNFLVAGLYPANFFQANPDAAGIGTTAAPAGAFLLTNGANSTYNGLHVELRRRMSRGLMLNANYAFSKSLTDLYADSATSTLSYTTLRNPGLDKGRSPWDLRHVFRMQWIYELPIGPGHRLTMDNKIVSHALEGWSVMGIVALQSGRVIKLTSGRYTFNQNDSGVILPTGVTADVINSMMSVVKPAGTPGKSTGYVYYVDPSTLVGATGRANTAYLQVPTTPGALGSYLFVNGPKFIKPDFTVAKNTKLTEKLKMEFRAQFFNAFNYQNFLVGAPNSAALTDSIDSTSFGRTSTIFNDGNNQDPGPRMIELMLRFTF